MSSLSKLAIVSLVVVAIGALQLAVPALSSKHSTKPIASALGSTAQHTAPELTNHPLNDYQNVNHASNAKSGTLYFIREQSGSVEVSDQYSLSPLLNTKVDIKVTGIVARTTLTQTFKNASNHRVNAQYVFPLPENAAVDHLLMTIGDRKIEGKIKQNTEAKKIYRQAKAEGKKASLVAQQRPNMFSNSIANIGPGETIIVSIEYQQRLNFDQQQYSLRFPMTITPRYYPNGTNKNPEIQVEPNQFLSNNEIELQVNLHAGFSVQNIASEFHPISINQQTDGSQHIQMLGGEIANQDFVLNWRPERGAAPQSAHFTQQVNGDEYGLVMLLPPNSAAEQNQIPLREVIYVLDTSGSMEGDSIQQAKQALLLAIEQLQEKDSFNIIEFNSYAQNLWRFSKQADANNKDEAKHFINSLSANGGTEMASALKLAFSQPKTNAPNILRQIVFITDGSVGNEEALMGLISTRLKNSRLFTVGIGSAPNSYFMSEAAKMGKGTFTYIGSVDQVQEKMLGLITKLQHPALTDIELQVNANASHTDQQLEFYPNVISDLYKDEPIVLSYKLNNEGTEIESTNELLSKLKLTANYQAKPWENTLQLSAQTRQSGLNVLWAREKISQLSRDKRLASMRPNNSTAEQERYKALITETALSHHIVSQYTSLIAVDVTPTRPTESALNDKKNTNAVPRGTTNRLIQSQGQLPQTATTAQLKIIIGLILIGISVCMRLLTKRKEKFQGYCS